MSALPFPRPGKVICVGLNYRTHAEEAGLSLPHTPLLFAKLVTAIVGDGTPIQIPRISDQIDYEAELGVLIGERARGISPRRALDVVAGYTCFNDVTARDLQRGDGQWMRGKSLDTFGPVGPRLVASSEITDPQALAISCRVNGKLMQESNTSDMIFSVAEIIAFISEAITLEPGDLIATGTPSGVGSQRNPPRWLRPGDTVAVEIDCIGSLINPIIVQQPRQDTRVEQ